MQQQLVLVLPVLQLQHPALQQPVMPVHKLMACQPDLHSHATSITILEQGTHAVSMQSNVQPCTSQSQHVHHTAIATLLT